MRRKCGPFFFGEPKNEQFYLLCLVQGIHCPFLKYSYSLPICLKINIKETQYYERYRKAFRIFLARISPVYRKILTLLGFVIYTVIENKKKLSKLCVINRCKTNIALNLCNKTKVQKTEYLYIIRDFAGFLQKVNS